MKKKDNAITENCNNCVYDIYVFEEDFRTCHLLDWGGISDEDYEALQEYADGGFKGKCPQFKFNEPGDYDDPT